MFNLQHIIFDWLSCCSTYVRAWARESVGQPPLRIVCRLSVCSIEMHLPIYEYIRRVWCKRWETTETTHLWGTRKHPRVMFRLLILGASHRVCRFPVVCCWIWQY